MCQKGTEWNTQLYNITEKGNTGLTPTYITEVSKKSKA
jgi:hypothetical protein